jgi:N-acetylglutamate synthase-like GNAT family acetyltransferase
VKGIAVEDINIRQPRTDEFDTIYLMGFDVWSDGATDGTYLEGCRNSPKYRSGQWWIAEHPAQGLVSSLLVHSFGPNVYGIGSIATPTSKRQHGYASHLISKTIELLENENNATHIYLYSDIEPKFYERFGFVILPPDFQKYETTTCMLRAKNKDANPPKILDEVPKYF